MMFRGRSNVVPQNPMMGHGRLGDTATPGTFATGAELWTTPSAAFTAAQGILTNASSAFSSANLPYTLGILAVPVALVFLVMSMSKGKR